MRVPLAPAGRREIVIISVLCGVPAVAGFCAAAGGAVWGLPMGVVATLLWVAGLAFFRDPQRFTPVEPGILVAPADGKVTEVTALDTYEDIGGPATRIGIFLSIFDVHVNRSPCAGVVRFIHYRPGRFLDARDARSGGMNEANTIVIEPDEPGGGPVIVRQVAGRIARRIVCGLKVGDRVEAGQRIGLIKFGSRTELIVPRASRYAPVVKVGDRARGATTILARRMAETPVVGNQACAVRGAWG